MKIHAAIPELNPDYLVYAGAIGILLGLLFLIFFLYRRIRWVFGVLTKQKTPSPRLLASLRNLIVIIVWTSFFGMLLFFGFFLRAYHAFTYEEPVAEIITKPLDSPSAGPVALVKFLPTHSQVSRYLLVKGDQWVIEGDILKWESWVNFLGLRTRYRLTRLRGRYLRTEEEIHQPRTVYSLVDHENHPLWRYLYLYGHGLPLVSTVYGSAGFQTTRENKQYLIFVSASGFVVREKEERIYHFGQKAEGER